MERYLTQRRFRILQAGLIWLLAVLGFFALWELVEYIFFPVIPKYVMERLYLARGIVSALGSGVLAIWLFLKEDRRYRKEKIKRERIEVLDRFSSHMAHEIRNPLTALSLNTELLLQELPQMAGPKADECRSLLEMITKQIERLSTLTERYLNLSIHTSQVQDTFDPAVALKDLVESLQEEHGSKGIHIILGVPKDFTLSLAGNLVMFREALRNVILNGIEAMPRGGDLKVTITERRQSFTITISDMGVGMTKDTQERVFEPFFTTKLKGAGLGLCLAYQQLGAFDASLRFQSAVGKGTSFQIEFPLLKSNPVEVKT